MTAAALSLAHFPRVPAEFTFRRDARNPKLARFARFLLELGILREDDAPRPARADESAFVERALRRWSEKVTRGPLAVLGDVYLCLNPDSPSRMLEAFSYTGEDTPDVDPENAVALSVSPWDRGDLWLLEKRCSAIEARRPGLAETAVHLLDYGAGRSVAMMTPSSAWEMASDLLYGWDTEGEAEHELLKKQFEQAMPRWVYQPKRKLTRDALIALSRREPVAHACVALLDAVADRKAAPKTIGGFWHTVLGALIRWSEDDPIPRIADDYVHDAENGGESSPDYSWHFVELERDAVETFFDGFARMLHTLACTDRLIALLAEKQTS